MSQGRTVLATDTDGFIADGADHGLFAFETRMLSRYCWRIDGRLPYPVALSNFEQHTWLGYYIMTPPGIAVGAEDHGTGLMQQESEYTLELRLSRYVGTGMHEDVDLTNFTEQTTRFRLELDLDADFADLQETHRGRQQLGDLQRQWRRADDGAWELTFHYHAEREYDVQGNRGVARVNRGLVVRVENADAVPEYRDGRIAFDVELAGGEKWHTCVDLVPQIEHTQLPPSYSCRSFYRSSADPDRRRNVYLEESTRFHTPGSDTLASCVASTLEQAKHDLAALRLYDLDHGDRAWTMAAGLPIYVALFGRDTLTAAWQAALANPAMLRGTLAELARWQGTETNDWRDEQPGKMLHEAHTGPLGSLNFQPSARYYGSITSSAFYPVVVSELWHWTGDVERVGPLIEPALRALRWLEQYSDRDENGFYEYLTRSTQGVRHQAWKDSPDAIVDPDGRFIEPPIATCEEQGFVYAAKLQMSEVLWWFDRRDEARQLYRDAVELKQRFNDAFWMEDEGFYALGLGPDANLIRSITSNPGHCIATAIADHALVERAAERLMSEELFTGWGIRTLSDKNPAYNPYSYHRGSVWPVEHGTFALGFYRYGLHDLVERICRAQFEAATLFDFYRLPEVFSGHRRDEDHPFPAFYPQANSPQAWSASAVFSLVQSMLGIYPYAPLNLLLVDPHLPSWLPEITLQNLCVGDSSATLRFYRKPDGSSSYEVLDRRGALRIFRQPSPWSLTASFGERLTDVLTSLVG